MPRRSLVRKVLRRAWSISSSVSRPSSQASLAAASTMAGLSDMASTPAFTAPAMASASVP